VRDGTAVIKVSVGTRSTFERDLHNEFNHDSDPRDRKIPVKKIELLRLGAAIQTVLRNLRSSDEPQ
jgi:hypothetical protein